MDEEATEVTLPLTWQRRRWVEDLTAAYETTPEELLCNLLFRDWYAKGGPGLRDAVKSGGRVRLDGQCKEATK